MKRRYKPCHTLEKSGQDPWRHIQGQWEGVAVGPISEVSWPHCLKMQEEPTQPLCVMATEVTAMMTFPGLAQAPGQALLS